ncbi:hypothetical protein KCP73_05325 [Salmonella enterica subsp. enterica]|nr:hypothetical protein KCP73_05325 [Salmonella enterica subsp. enterica]
MHTSLVLADDRSVLLGVMCSNIEIGSYAFIATCVLPAVPPPGIICKR